MPLNRTTRQYLDVLDGRSVTPEELARAARESDLLNVAFGDRFLARPVFLEHEETLSLEQDLVALYDLLADLPRRLYDGDTAAFCAAVGMTPVQTTAVLRTAGDRPVRLGRADLYHDGSGFKVLEFNVGGALGSFDVAELNRAMLRHDVLRTFVEARRLAFVDTLAAIAATVRVTCRSQLDIQASRPVVALVDWPTSFESLAPRLHHMARLLAPEGFDAIACHIGQLTYRDGRVFLGGRAVDIVYRFFLVEDLIGGPEAEALVAPLLKAHEAGTVQIFTGFDSEMLGNKQALALLNDARDRGRLGSDECDVVDRVLPWTREVRPGTVTVDGDEVELIEYLRAHRTEMVLKPSLMHGGIGVSAGWTMTQEAWESALTDAFKQPTVAQRRVVPATEPFPMGCRDVQDIGLNWGAFLTSEGFGGAVVRGSADREVGVVSMANGALVGCCFAGSGRTA